MVEAGMSWRFAAPIARMELCATNNATEKARQLAAVCDLSIGDVKFDTPRHIRQAAIRSIEENDTHYSPVQGTLALRRAIAAKFRREDMLDYAIDEIVVGNGAGQIMFGAFFATLQDGDEVIIPAPCWDNYGDMVMLNRGVPVYVSGATTNRVSVADLVAAITSRTRWIILNNPNNPGGFMWSAGELAQLADALRRDGRSIGVIADETFDRLCFGGVAPVSFATLPGMRERTLTVNGLSKSHAMSGWRIGYAGGPKALIDKIVIFNANTTYSLCNAAQAAAVAALAESTEAEQAVADLKAAIGESRFAACSRLSLVNGASFRWPVAGYFILLDVRPLIGDAGGGTPPRHTVRELCDYLITHAGAAVTDGAAFQAPGHIRLSFAGPEPLIAEVYDRIVRALTSFPLASFLPALQTPAMGWRPAMQDVEAAR